MSHHIYTTRALVCGLYPVKEADKQVLALTRDLGLVSTNARGARKLESKLSSNLLDLALVKLSLVKGKNAWRVTTVTLFHNVATELRERRKALLALARIVALVKRLVRGEEKHIELYEDLERATLILLNEVGDEDVDAWELLTVARILFNLGYLSKESLPTNLIETREKRKVLLELVNSGIQASGLYHV